MNHLKFKMPQKSLMNLDSEQSHQLSSIVDISWCQKGDPLLIESTYVHSLAKSCKPFAVRYSGT